MCNGKTFWIGQSTSEIWDENPFVLSEFDILPPGDVEYDTKSRVVKFQLPSYEYCGRIEVDQGEGWQEYEPCAPSEVKIDNDIVVTNLQVALCVGRRQDVCSEYEEAEFGKWQGDWTKPCHFMLHVLPQQVKMYPIPVADCSYMGALW